MMNLFKKRTHSFIRVCLLLLISLMGIGVTNNYVHAEEQNTSSLKVEIQPNDISTTTDDIRFSPEVNKEYYFTATITNIGNKPIDVSIFPSIGISTSNAITYEKATDNLLNPDYDLTSYVKVIPLDEKLEGGILKLEANQSKDVQIVVNVNKELKGEILGGVNFSQVISKQENKDSVDIVQVYQKVIVVRLKMNDLTVEKDQTYDNFKFTSSSDATLLSYYLSNNNPEVAYAENGAYKVVNPDDNVIAKGEFEKNKVVLSPYTKTQLSVPLLDGAELVSGEYKFIINVSGKEKESKFTYSKEEVKDFVEKTSEKNNVTVKSQNNTWLIVLLVVITAMFIFTIAKSYVKSKKV